MSGSQRMPMVVSGPLAPCAAGFAAELRRAGYSPSAVRLRVWQLDGMSRWLEVRRLLPNELTAERAEEYLAARRARGYRSWVSTRGLCLPMGYLREVGAVPAPAFGVAQGPVEELLARYRAYLLTERGLAKSTIEFYGRVAALFLRAHASPQRLGLEDLDAGDVIGFVGRECARRSVCSAKYLVAGLRSVLRYLHLSGATSTALVWAVPGVATGRGLVLPRGLRASDVARLLGGCDRRREVGRRDYAILTLLVRLGLRSAEVAALRLDDVDWHRGEIMIRGKGDRHERLPLPCDVGEALVAYLRPGPGPGTNRSLFQRVNAPHGPLRASAVSAVVHDACIRAGLAPVGAHRLRHTAATEMLRAGGSLPEIAQVLRHRHLDSTALYARVDSAALRPLAQPWPGAR
jgi:integrase/recombinase XerD